MSQLPAMTGWAWLKQGIAMFRKQPAALTTLLFADVLISGIIAALPILGPILAVVLIPVFSMAFMQACMMIDRDERVTPAVLLTGFRSPALGALLKIGLVYLAVFVVLALIIKFSVDPALLRAGDPRNTAAVPDVAASDLLTVLFVFLLQAAAMLTLSFTAPLTYWHKMGTFKAIFYSFFAVLRAGRAFVMLLLSWLAILFIVSKVASMLFGSLGIIAGVIILWIFFLFYLLLQCAIYAGYRQIFGTPTDVTVQKAP